MKHTYEDFSPVVLRAGIKSAAEKVLLLVETIVSCSSNEA